MPALVIDASLPAILTGILDDAEVPAWRACCVNEEPALEAVFSGVRTCLDEAGLDLAGIDRFVHCEGPGATLGLRISAMAIRAWRALPEHREKPLFTYRSLEAAARALELDGAAAPPFHLITEYRQKQWHVLSVAPGGAREPITALGPGELAGLPGTLYHLPARKAWHEPPGHAIKLSAHPLAQCPAAITGSFAPAQEANLFALEVPEYKTWTGERHRASAP